MGFFFDYNAPVEGEGELGHHVTSPVAVGGTDWFEMQLAGVDALGSGGRGAEFRIVDGVENGNGDGNVGKGLDNGRGEEEEKEVVVDVNVPEHLPSSPLCPRHWKHRSGGMAVCWMHGRNREGGARERHHSRV